MDVSDGVKSAVRLTFPRVPGAVQLQVAVVDAADAAPHPEIVEPPILKFTVPARETVAVMVTVPDAAAVVAEFGKAIEIEEAALLTVIVKTFVPTWLLPSVARTVWEYVPAAVAEEAVTVVPEIVTPEIDEPRDQVYVPVPPVAE